jgi:hypothetical protein
MRVDKVNQNHETRTASTVDITWTKLIDDAECEIDLCQDRISKLRKSIRFFEKQESLGLGFPDITKRHGDFS